MLLIAGITFALPYTDRWDYGPALLGFWIVLAFGYVGFAQFLPAVFVPPIGIPIVVVLAILYLVAGIGSFSGRRWAWALGITLALGGVASSILQIITWTQQIGFFAVPGLVVAVLALVYLTRPLARNFFFKRC
jgi:hypothetical protein